jgi:hypothetical protein
MTSFQKSIGGKRPTSDHHYKEHHIIFEDHNDTPAISVWYEWIKIGGSTIPIVISRTQPKKLDPGFCFHIANTNDD